MPRSRGTNLWLITRPDERRRSVDRLLTRRTLIRHRCAHGIPERLANKEFCTFRVFI